MAIDRDEINTKAYEGARIVSTGITPPGIPGFKADIGKYAKTDAAEAKVKKSGAVTAPAQTLFDVVRKLPEGAEVSLDLGEGKLSISSGRSRFSTEA